MLFEIVIGVLSGLASATVVAGFFWSIFAQLKRDIRQLETDKVNTLQGRFERHVESDQTQRMISSLDRLAGDICKMDNKLDRIAEDTAKQAAQIAANESYIRNLDDSFKRHKVGDSKHGD